MGDALDSDDQRYSALNPLLWYRIASRPRRFAALAPESKLVDIVDRGELAQRTTIADLGQMLPMSSTSMDSGVAS
jgi:hypothetical protein